MSIAAVGNMATVDCGNKSNSSRVVVVAKSNDIGEGRSAMLIVDAPTYMCFCMIFFAMGR